MLSEGTEQVQVGCTQLQSVNSPVRNSWPSCLSTNILHIFCCLSSVASNLWACNQPALCCPKKTISCKDPTLIDAVTLQHMPCLAHLGAFFPKPPHKEKVSHAPAVDELRCVQDPDCSAKRHGGNMGCYKKKKKKKKFSASLCLEAWHSFKEECHCRGKQKDSVGQCGSWLSQAELEMQNSHF